MRHTKPGSPRILLVDDQPDVLAALRLLIKAEGYDCETAGSPAEALRRFSESDFDLALVDLNYSRDTTSGQEGMDLLGRLLAVDPTVPVVVMTAWGSVELAVEAMRRGAGDFLQKPWENERVAAILRTQLALRQSARNQRRLEAENELLRDRRGPRLIAESAAMQPVLELISRVGPSDANVLVLGENGTGKGLVAALLHSVSGRSARSFVSVNMGGFSEGVFESELFGHVKGAFTDAKSDRVGRFEMADGGTLFLDEIANITPGQQTRLLRVLETGQFERVGSSRTLRADVRLISATNADPRAEIASGRFRQDLLFRLNTIEISLPPLRQRKEDIPLLAEHFLKVHANRYRKAISGFEPLASSALAAHAWPGNVREMDHVIERAVLMAKGSSVHAADLGLHQSKAAESNIDEMSLEEVERRLIQRTLARCGGNALKAAEALGLSRSAFYRRMEKHGL